MIPPANTITKRNRPLPTTTKVPVPFMVVFDKKKPPQ